MSGLFSLIWATSQLPIGRPIDRYGCKLFAPYIGGLLYDRFGFQAPILANLVGITIALVGIIVAVKEPPPDI